MLFILYKYNRRIFQIKLR